MPLPLPPVLGLLAGYIEVRIGRRVVLRQRAHSPVQNWAELLRGFFDESDATVVATNGATCTIDTQANQGYCNYGYTYTGLKLTVSAGAGVDAYGLIFGYGTRPVSYTDYALDYKYPQGTGAGYLDYGATQVSGVNVETVTIDTKTYTALTVVISRSVVNPHTDYQRVTEMGLVIRYTQPRFTTCDFLVMRDLLDNPVDIPPQETATFAYYLRFLLPG